MTVMNVHFDTASERDVALTSLPPETLAAFAQDTLRARIFAEKYALCGADGTMLERTPQQLWRRGARELAAVEAAEHRQEWEEKFVWLLANFRLAPGGRILHAMGNANQVT